jgi:hypothetical protein
VGDSHKYPLAKKTERKSFLTRVRILIKTIPRHFSCSANHGGLSSIDVVGEGDADWAVISMGSGRVVAGGTTTILREIPEVNNEIYLTRSLGESKRETDFTQGVTHVSYFVK